MRITLVCISLRGGGTERIVCRIANYLADQHEVSIITLAFSAPFYPLDERVCIKSPPVAVQQHSKLLRVVLQFKHLFSACRYGRPDICLVFGEDISGIACLTARLAGVSRVWVFFRGTPKRSLKGVNGVINPLLCRLANRIMVQTRATKKRLSGSYSSDKITVWPNPVEVVETVTPAFNREPVIVNVGSIGRLKNQEGLLRIFNRLEIHGSWRLIFIGDGPKRTALEAQTANLELGSSVMFFGEQEDVNKHLNQSAIFAFTSLSEGFPNALAEALANGCACISYDCPTGPSELIEHGVNGFLVDLGDENSFARLLQKLIDDEELRTQFSINARENIKRYEAVRVMKQLEAMLRDESHRVEEFI